MENFHKWLRTHVPKDISSIVVDEVFQQTDQIQAWLQKSKRPDLCDAIVDDIQQRGHRDSVVLQPSALDVVEPVQDNPRVESTDARIALNQLRKWNDQVYQSIQSNVLLNPSFYSPAAMERLERDESASEIGLSECARLRLLNERIRSNIHQSRVSALAFDSLKDVHDSGQPRSYGAHSTGTVFIENYNYGDGFEPKESVLLRIGKLSTLLLEVSDPMFRIAPYLGHIDRPVSRQIGLVFQAVSTADSFKKRPYVTLAEAYRQEKIMSLNARLSLALGLSRALANLHAVGWLHKSLRSDNIVFFANSGGREGYDYGRPYIFGFDISRPRTDPSEGTKEYRRAMQLYTHPRRWGKPQETFAAMHDIYALGVVLLELGCWRQAGELDKAKRGFLDVNDEEELRGKLVQAAKTSLRHMAGDQYSEVVVTCLADEFEVEAGNTEDLSMLHKAFLCKVIEPLDRALIGL
ncbi:hypothetical protein Daus18300_009940 [Diaporthe australafricana]|uniref:Protein kinase domain-containing protein n=1 Tax=Diaporthe australafricana TaxID=127596 RepID=A0ABR3WC49_9PEZI